MNRRFSSSYFDLSTILALGFAALLLVSLPGGCGDGDGEDETVEDEETETEVVAEATEVPMMEIVEPEPGDLVIESDDQEDNAGEEAEPGSEDGEPSPDESEGEAGEENAEQDSAEQVSSYVVQEGDTLYGIAVEFGVSMEDLMAANDMDNPDQLQVGQELQIP